MKVLYIYSGERRDKFRGEIGKDYPDNQFYGLNHLPKFGIQAEYKEFGDLRLPKVFSKLPFSVKHAILTVYYSIRGEYDIIFGASEVYGLFFKSLLGLKQKIVLHDLSICRLVSSNRKNIFKIRMIARALSSANAIITLSNHQKSLLEKNLPELKDKVHVVKFGIDVQYYMPKFTGRGGYVLSAGRDNGRDYATVYKVARLLPDKQFEINCSRRNIEKLGEIPSNIKISLDLPHRELYSKFLEAKMLLLTTHSDSYGDGSDCSGQTVLLEVMAAGTPVVATRKGYQKDYIREGKDALIFEPYDAEGIATCLRSIDEGRLGEISHNARETVEEHFTTYKMAEGLSAVFKNLA